MSTRVVHRSILLAVLLVLGSGRADARILIHYDLAGLLLQADSVVVADRMTGPDGDRGGYRIVRSLRGTRRPGDVIEIYDGSYKRRGMDTRAVLFLTTHDGEPQLVLSGLRVIEGGLVWRFEQQENPGGFEMIPQGKDPQDQWGRGGAQLDLAGLERAISDAQTRIDALAAARSISDPAKRRAIVLSLFPPGASAIGAYVDLLAERARAQLVAAGDLEGALLVDRRDRGMSHGRDFATLVDVVAIARDRKRALEVRLAALAVAGRALTFSDDLASLQAVATLIEDPDPDIRALAVATAVQPAGVITSDPVGQRKLDAAVAEVRKAIAKRYAIERDRRVLVAILAAYDDSFHEPPPFRASAPRVVAAPSLAGDDLGADVYCARRTRIRHARLTLQGSAGPVAPGAFSIRTHCDDISGTAGFEGNAPPPGAYRIGVELTLVDGSKIALPLGSLFVDASGERHLVP